MGGEIFEPRFRSRREAFTGLAIGAVLTLAFGAAAYLLLTRVFHSDPAVAPTGVLMPVAFQACRLRRRVAGFGLGAVAGTAVGYGVGALAPPGGVVLPWIAGVVTGALVALLAGQPRDT